MNTGIESANVCFLKSGWHSGTESVIEFCTIVHVLHNMFHRLSKTHTSHVFVPTVSYRLLRPQREGFWMKREELRWCQQADESLLSSRSMCTLYKNTALLSGLCKTGWFIIGVPSAERCLELRCPGRSVLRNI